VEKHWTNSPVVDEHQHRIGKVTDVIFGEVGDEPQFATVKTGLITERIAPLDGAYFTEDGTLVLPYDQQAVKNAPKAPRDHVLTPAVAAEVEEYWTS
jgi:rRNA processing protein Gar1